MTLLLQLLANALVTGACSALLALAFGILYRADRVFHIAFAGLFMIGPMSAHAMYRALGLPAWLALLAGILVGTAAGYVIERFVYQPMFRRRASPGGVLVASLGALAILQNAAALSFGNRLRTFDWTPQVAVSVGHVNLSSIQLLEFSVSALLIAVVLWGLRSVPLLRMIWVMGDEPGLLAVFGGSIRRCRLVVAVLSAALAGIAASLIVLDVGIEPNMGMSYLLTASVAVFAGGFDRAGGWILAAFVLAALQAVTVWMLSPRWVNLAIYAALIVAIAFRPRGFLGVLRRPEEAT